MLDENQNTMKSNLNHHKVVSFALFRWYGLIHIFIRPGVAANRYTKLENLAGSKTVLLQDTFCKKRRFMKPLLLSRVEIFIHTTGCLLLTLNL